MFRQFGLIGKKLGHSFSKKYFTEKYAASCIEAAYNNFELPEIEAFPALIDSVPDLSGLNVTIPYKTAVMPFLDAISPDAQAVGAVNTIKFEAGKLTGYNTDTYGFYHSLMNLMDGEPVTGALVLGTGGAAKAVVYVLKKKLGLANLLYVSRNPSGSDQISYDRLTEPILSAHNLIINTTPLGMYPDVHSAPLLPYELLGPSHYAFDLIYNPTETLFMKKASARGAKSQNGYEMLVLQAEKAWEIWNQ